VFFCPLFLITARKQEGILSIALLIASCGIESHDLIASSHMFFDRKRERRVGKCSVGRRAIGRRLPFCCPVVGGLERAEGFEGVGEYWWERMMTD